MSRTSDLTNYDSIAEVYIAHEERPDSWNNLYERPYMLSQFPSFKNKHVLDLGAGSGFYSEYALRLGARVTAIDVSKVLIDKLSSRLHSTSFKTFCADIARPLSFLEADSFDYIICSLVIHYVKDWGPLLVELYRVLKKRGKVFISTHHPSLVLYYRLLRGTNYFDTVLVEDIWGSKDHPFKVHYYTRSLTSTLKPIIDSKFKIISIDEPLPDERCKQQYPEKYKRLSERPGFLFIVLGK